MAYNLDSQGNPIPTYIPSGSTIVDGNGIAQTYNSDYIKKNNYTTYYLRPGENIKTSSPISIAGNIGEYENFLKEFQSGGTPAGTTGDDTSSIITKQSEVDKGPILTSSGVFFSGKPDVPKQFFAPNATGGLTEGLGDLSAQERVAASADKRQASVEERAATEAENAQTQGGNRSVSMVQGGQEITQDGQTTFQGDPNYQARVARQAQAAPVTPDPRTGQYALQSGETESQRIQRLKKLGLYDPVKELSDIKDRALSIQSQIQNLPAETPQAMQTYQGLSTKFGLPDVQTMQSSFFSDPIATIKDITKQIFSMSGVDQANSLITEIADELEEFENKRDQAIRDINDDPWITEGVRIRQIEKARAKYSDEINNRVNKLQLLESVRDDARQQAQFALSTAISMYDSERRFQQDQIQMYYDQAQREFDNAIKVQQLNAPKGIDNAFIEEYMFAVQQGFQGTSLDYRMAVAAAGRAPSTGGTDELTPGQLSAFNSIVGKYNASPLIAAADRTVVLQNTIDQIKKNPSNGPLQLNLVYSYIQALDTYQSAVREGELGLVNSIDSKIGQLSGSIQKIQNGQIVRPEVALDIASAATKIVDTINQAAQRKAQSFQSQANTVGLGDYWNQYIGGFQQGYNAPAQESSTDILNSMLGGGQSTYTPPQDTGTVDAGGGFWKSFSRVFGF